VHRPALIALILVPKVLERVGLVAMDRPLTRLGLEESPFFPLMPFVIGIRSLGRDLFEEFSCKDVDGGDGEEYDIILFNVARGFEAAEVAGL
jgi:hypothetical protein